MDYPTASTVWSRPEPPANVKNLINLFFTLADSKEDNAGDRLAEEVFTPDGKFSLAQGTFQGTSEIRASRKEAWTTIKARCHTVLKAYANTANSHDFIFIGRLEATMLDGSGTSKEFVARMLIEESISGPRVTQYRVINPASQDASPMIEHT